MSEQVEQIKEWVVKDPSDARLALLVNTYNWGLGMELLHWVLETYDIDKAAALELAYRAEFSSFNGCKTEEDVVENLGQFYLDNWRLLGALESGWQNGKFRTQRFAPLQEVKRAFYDDSNPYKGPDCEPERLPQFTLLAELTRLDPKKLEIAIADFGEDGWQLQEIAT